MGASESLGTIQGDAQIDVSGMQQSMDALNKMMSDMNARAVLTEQGFIKIEQAGKNAAGSINDLRDKSNQLQTELNALNPRTQDFIEKATALNSVMKELKSAQDAAGTGMKTNTIATQALSTALGVLGVVSIQSVIQKAIQLGQEAVDLAINFQGVENRAKVIFGTSFPQMERAAGTLATQFQRSRTQILDFTTGFATILDTVGTSTAKVDGYSQSLTALTENLGKAFPNKSDADIYNIVSYAIEGNVRGLRQLGIVMTQKSLQDYAESQGIQLKIKDMSDEQLMMLRTQYLLNETTKLQQAGIDSTGQLGDAVKSTAGQWQDLLTEFGTDLSPILASANQVVVSMLQQWVGWIQDVQKALINMFTLLASGGENKRIQDGFVVNDVAKPGFKTTNQSLMSSITDTTNAPSAVGDTSSPGADFWKNQAAGGAAANKELADAKKVKSDIDTIEKDITKSLDDQAKANLDKTKSLRDELLLRQQLGILTSDEQKTLDSINNRMEFKKTLVDEATKAWQQEADEVKKVEDNITSLNQKILDEQKSLQQSLADIDKNAGRSKADKAAELYKEKQQYDDILATGGTLSGDQSKKYGDITAQLGSLDSATQIQGQSESQLNDFQKIDLETARKKADATEKADARIADLQTELDAETKKLTAVKTAEAEKKKVVIDSLKDRENETLSSYKVIEDATATHVATQIAQLSQLKAALDALAQGKAVSQFETSKAKSLLPGFAGGGPIFGPGTGTSDSIIARLSNGEYVMPAAATSIYRPILDAMRTMSFQIPRFASGGPVTQSMDHSRTANVNVYNYGEAARVLARPDLLRWQVRMALR